MNCEGPNPFIKNGYEIAKWTTDVITSESSTNKSPTHRQSVLKCPFAESCLAQNLSAKGSQQPDHNCSTGHAGVLCFACAEGYRKGPKGSCTVCQQEGWNPLFLVPVFLMITYAALRSVLAHRRKKRVDKLVQAAEMFHDMDLDGSGEISRYEMLEGMRALGHFKEDPKEKEAEKRLAPEPEPHDDSPHDAKCFSKWEAGKPYTKAEFLKHFGNSKGTKAWDDATQAADKREVANKRTAIKIFDRIDLDRSSGINLHEFVAWMEHNMSQTKVYTIVAKILFGLFQVLSRQPDTIKEEFPGGHWDEFKFINFVSAQEICHRD